MSLRCEMAAVFLYVSGSIWFGNSFKYAFSYLYEMCEKCVLWKKDLTPASTEP
jgi:hypothetical protein